MDIDKYFKFYLFNEIKSRGGGTNEKRDSEVDTYHHLIHHSHLSCRSFIFSLVSYSSYHRDSFYSWRTRSLGHKIHSVPNADCEPVSLVPYWGFSQEPGEVELHSFNKGKQKYAI